MESTSPNDQRPSWLKDQQHNSWQIEILISGGFVFFIAQLPEQFNSILFRAFMLQDQELSSLIPILVFGGYIFSRAILIGFIVNLVLRALWVGFLGIDYAYPKGIDYQQLNYSSFFRQKTDRGKTLVERIINLEKITSLAYSIAILITLMSIGIFFCLLLIFGLIERLFAAYNDPGFGMILLIFIFLTRISLLDELIFNLLKRWTWLSRLYYPVYKFLDLITLSFLYKKEWTNLISHGRRWLIYSLITVYFALAISISYTSMVEFATWGVDIPTFSLEDKRSLIKQSNDLFSNLYAESYEDYLTEESIIYRVCISGPVVKDRHLSIFVSYRHRLDDGLSFFMRRGKVETTLDSIMAFTSEDRSENQKRSLQALGEFFVVSIDSVRLEEQKWYFTTHPKTGQEGFQAFVDIDSLLPGHHELKLDYYFPVSDSTARRTNYYPMGFVKE